MCGYSGDNKPIFVDEQLTQQTYELLAQAKALKKLGVKYVWTSNGDILCRERDESPVTKIDSLAKVKAIEKKLVLSNKKKAKRVRKKEQNKESVSSDGEFFSEAE